MELIRGWHNLKPPHRGCVLTIGNFDGVHHGHKILLNILMDESRRLQLPSLVITFEPQPNEFFSHGKKTSRLMSLREKIQALDEVGIDRLLVVYFNEAFAQVSAEEFVRDYLVGRLGVKRIIVGDDFHFGAKRLGDVMMLEKLAPQYDFEVDHMLTYADQGERVSSTLVRQSLERGELERAEQLLGHRYSLSGRVVHGDKLGRTLGFPTANIYLHRLYTPVHGIFAVLVEGLGPNPLKGVASVGSRPTVGGTKVILEVYLFDFDEDIYGRHVRVNFVAKHRDEEKFPSVEAMRLQIVEDAEWARGVLRRING